MRKLTDHIVNPANDKITIEVHGEPSSGNANHLYAVYGFHTANNPDADSSTKDETSLKVLFQNGPINEVGVNGVTQEVLLAIVADRLRSFQDGPYKCKENACALTHIEEAMHWLQQRTIARMRRGVEGTHTV